MKNAQELVADARKNIQEISCSQLSALLQHTAAPVAIIDVREPTEFAQQHIKGAVNYPRGVLEMTLHQHPLVAAHACDPAIALSKLAEQDIYLICRSGGRSALAAESLQRMGFCRVFSVAGGMQDWIENGFATKSLLFQV